MSVPKIYGFPELPMLHDVSSVGDHVLESGGFKLLVRCEKDPVFFFYHRNTLTARYIRRYGLLTTDFKESD